MGLRTLPRPLPDELLYSALARATYRYGFWSPKQLLDALYGSRTVVAVPDLPSNLSRLAQTTQDHWQLSTDELAIRHTLFGYYTHFQSAPQRKQVLAAMAADGGSLQVRLGVCAGSARTPKQFRLCLSCHAVDVAQFGEAYWHRAHHLPGVVVCHLHGDMLVESNVPFRPSGRHAYLAAPMDGDHGAFRPILDAVVRPEVARAVATRSFELLTERPSPATTRPDYRSRLGQRLSGSGRAQKFRQAFVEYFGEDLLVASFRRKDGDPLAWLAEVLRVPRRPMHPFKHALMEVFLSGPGDSTDDCSGTRACTSGKRWGVYRMPVMRQEAASLVPFGLSIHAIARALDVDWKTADRLLTPMPALRAVPTRDLGIDRRAWEDSAAALPGLGKKGLRGATPALYARLYRHDRAWLLAWAPQRLRRCASIRRIDWHQRDIEVEALVREQVALTVQAVPPRRASRHHVLGGLGLRALLAHRSALLPRTAAALNVLCETVEACQLRRLELVLRRQGNYNVPDWKLLREARIQSSRFVDRGRSLILLARQRIQRLSFSACKQGPWP